MRAFRSFRKINQLTARPRYFIFAQTPKSYYDILGVPSNATPKQIRSEFLKKARQLHPDHNPSSEAQQQFKTLKQAYQVLRDPQKRYSYDSGITTENVDETMYAERPTWRQSGRKYYENKWYEFKKSNYEDQRDEYYEEKIFRQENAHQKTLWYRAIGILILVGGYFSYEYIKNKKSEADLERENVKKVLEGSVEDKNTRRVRRYIQQRSKANRVD